MHFAYGVDMATTTTPNPEAKATTIRIPQDLAAEVKAASQKVNLTQQATAELAMERGLKVLLAQLGADPVATFANLN